jgi:glc operon protein GlcG
MVNQMSLGCDEAIKAISAVVAAMKAKNLAAVVAVADAQGELIALQRMDGAPLAPINIAMNKAWTAARERQPSQQIGQAARHPQTGFDISYYSDPRYIGWGGGLPVMINGKTVGSVAVSGLPENIDIEFAQIGVKAILDSITPTTA